MLMVISRIFGLLPADMAIDLGTSTTRVCVRGKGLVTEEPTVLAVKKGTCEVLNEGRGQAIGQIARDMMGREPGSIEVIRPLRGGAIVDIDMTRALLKYFIQAASGSRRWANPRLVINAPTDISDVDKRALQEVAERAGARKVYLIDQPRAAGMGSFLPIHQARGHMIIDIGAGSTDISVLTLGDVVESRSVPVAGNSMDEAIISYIRKQFNILVGKTTAEKAKLHLASSRQPGAAAALEVSGQDLLANVPRSVALHPEDIWKAINPQVSQLVDSVADMVARLGPELSSDLIANGITLCGGGAQLSGLADRIEIETNARVYIPDNPACAVARGLSLVLKYFDDFRPILECTEDRY